VITAPIANMAVLTSSFAMAAFRPLAQGWPTTQLGHQAAKLGTVAGLGGSNLLDLLPQRLKPIANDHLVPGHLGFGLLPLLCQVRGELPPALVAGDEVLEYGGLVEIAVQIDLIVGQ
jgi:hypothetical protein